MFTVAYVLTNTESTVRLGGPLHLRQPGTLHHLHFQPSHRHTLIVNVNLCVCACVYGGEGRGGEGWGSPKLLSEVCLSPIRNVNNWHMLNEVTHIEQLVLWLVLPEERLISGGVEPQDSMRAAQMCVCVCVWWVCVGVCAITCSSAYVCT